MNNNPFSISNDLFSRLFEIDKSFKEERDYLLNQLCEQYGLEQVGRGCFSQAFSCDEWDFVIKSAYYYPEKFCPINSDKFDPTVSYIRYKFWKDYIFSFAKEIYVFDQNSIMIQEKGEPLSYEEWCDLDLSSIQEETNHIIKTYWKKFQEFLGMEDLSISYADIHDEQFVKINGAIFMIDF